MVSEEHDAPPTTPDFLTLGVLTELGLGGLAFLLAGLLGGSPFGNSTHDWTNRQLVVQQVGLGLLATVPMLTMFVILDKLPWQGLRQIQDAWDDHLLSRLKHAQLPGVVAIALAAGFGEELLFRGWLQPWVAQWFAPPYGVWIGLGVASLLFGLCHWMNWVYGVIAGLIGVYLGVLAIWSGGILAAAVAHAAYDFVVLWIMLARQRAGEAVS